MFPYQPVNNHDDLLKVVDGLLLEAQASTVRRRAAT